jgi:hypothetical protein
MSSSRSIAAARNRRAGDPPSTSRPGTSIASQPAFSQQSQQSKRTTAQNSTPNVPVTSTKLTISDAIGLITLRLGRVEQFIQTAEHEGGINMGTNIPDNAHLVDKSVINSIVNRLDSLEKKEKESANNLQTTKLEAELRDIKDLLMSQMVKYEKFTLETNKRFDDVDAAFVELEKEQELAINSCDTVQTEEIVNTNTNTSTDQNVFSHLKMAIEQELADSARL